MEEENKDRQQEEERKQDEEIIPKENIQSQEKKVEEEKETEEKEKEEEEKSLSEKMEEKELEKEEESLPIEKEESSQKETNESKEGNDVELEIEGEETEESEKKKRKRLKKNKKEKKSKKEKKEKKEKKKDKSRKEGKSKRKEKENDKPISDDPFPEEDDVFGEGEEEQSMEEVEEPVKEMNEFDLACERLKKKRAKKLSGEELASFKDEGKELLQRMEDAYNRDRDDNESGRPALNKIKMLDEISSQFLTKQYALLRLFVDEGLLKTLKLWLDPYPDRSLPNMRVRETVLNILLGLPAQWSPEEEGREDFLEVGDLKESGIGQAVMLLAKHPNETTANKKIAKQLIERWSRSVFKTGSNYSHKETDEREINSPKVARESPSASTYNERLDLNSILDRSKEEKSLTNKNLSSYHARIPEKMKLDFTIMPRSQVDPKKKVTPKNNRFEKTFQKLKSGNGPKSSSISIEGRFSK